MIRLIKTVLLLMTAICLLSGAVAAQKIGFIDSEKIKASYPEWVKAEEIRLVDTEKDLRTLQ